MAEQALVFHQDIYYDFNNIAPLKDIIRSLQGLEVITDALPHALNGLLGSKISSVTIELKSIELGSEWLKYLAFLNFESKEDEERFFRQFGKKHKTMSRILSIAIFALVMAIIYKSLTASNGPSVNIHATNSTVIAAGADLIGITPKKFQEAVEATAESSPKLAKGSQDFLAPIRNDPEASIKFGRADGLTLDQKTISEIPLEFSRAQDYFEKDFSNVLIDIRATDLDYRNKGWSVFAAGLDKRLPASVYPHLDPAQLKDAAYANLGVLYKRDPSNPKKMFPTNIIIKSLGSKSLPVGTVSPFLASEDFIDEASTVDDHASQQRLFD